MSHAFRSLVIALVTTNYLATAISMALLHEGWNAGLMVAITILNFYLFDGIDRIETVLDYKYASYLRSTNFVRSTNVVWPPPSPTNIVWPPQPSKPPLRAPRSGKRH